MISLHPLRLRLRTNANVSTLFHSFYLIEYENNVVKIIRHRIPSNKYQLENIEAGLMGFLSDLKFNETTKETFGNFAITTSNGSLFNAFYRGSRERVFVGVSEYFFPSFARQILQDLTYVDKNSLYVTLLTLCEEPVLPMSHVSYSFQIGSLPRVIRFSSIDQINDINFSKLALSLLTPQMLVSAWESLMVEEKVLVVSNNTFLIQYICEFLRRIVLPLSIVTFSPYLPKEALPVIEAPFPYLVGGCSRNILDSQIDLSETVILDLDCRRVIHGSSGELTDTIAPPRMIRQLLNSLHQVMVAPLNELIGNPLPSSLSEGNNNVHDDYSSSNCQVIDKIINIFVTVNISLLTSRACGSTEVPTFFRRGSNISSYSSGANSPFQPTKHRPYLGFYRQTSSEINASGTMQLLRERYTDDENGSFVACWIEMDEMTFSVYEFIDDIPMAYFSIKNIRSISPLAIEPEGHVFEIILTNGKSYRFVATDPEARKGWVDFIEERMNVCKKQIGRVPIPGQSSNIGLNMNMNTSMSALRTSKTNYPSPSRSQHMSFSHADSFQDRDMILSSVKNTSMSYRENNRDRRDMNDSFARDNSNIHANSIRFLAQMANDTSMVAPDNVENDDDVRAPIIGYEDYLSTLNPSSSSNCILSQNEDTMLSQFRYKVNQTQMVRNFYSSIDCSDYESLFRQLGADAPLSAFAKDMFQDEVFPSFEQLLPTQASMSIIDFFSDLIETKTIPLNPTVDGSNSDDTAARSQLDNQSNSQMNTNRVDTPNQISSHSDSSILLQPEAFVLHVNAAYLESKKSKSRSVVSTTPDDTSDYSDKHVQIGGDVGVGDGGASTAQQFTFLSPIGEHPDESRLSMDSRPSPRPDLSDDLAACFTSSLKSISSESNKAIADALVLPVPLNDTIDASTTTNAVPIIASSVTESTSVSTPNSRSNSSDGGKWLNIKIHKVAISIDSISNEAQPPTIRSQEDTTIETHAEENIESVDAAINDPVGDEAVLDETTNDPSILPPLRISRRRHTIAVSKEATDHIPTAPEEIYTIKSKVAFDGEAEEPIPPALSPSTRPVKPVKPIKTASMRLSFNLDSDSISPSRTCSADSGDGMNILPPLNLSNPPSPIRSTAARSPQRRSKSVTEVSIRKESISKEFLPLTPTSVATKDSQKDTGLTSSTSKQRFSMKFGMSWTKGIYRKTDRVCKRYCKCFHLHLFNTICLII